MGTPAPTPNPTLDPTPNPTNPPTPNPTLDPTPAPTPDPTQGATPNPTNQPTPNLTPPPTPSSTAGDRMLYCGRPGKCNTLGGDAVQTDMNEPNGVRCCTTNPSLRWPNKCENKPTPLVYGQSKVPGCNVRRT